jgi:phosphatidylglycerophosphate synthase
MLTPNRVQTNIVAKIERRILNWICVRLPKWITPDRLTLFGVFGAFTVFSGYCLSRLDPAFLWLASLGSVLNWFGDSLDGSLARFRQIERPKYGYFLDSSVDVFCNLFIVSGLGFTLFVRMDVALFVLAGYYMLCIYAFLSHHVTGIYPLTYIGAGPTELRIGMIAINISMYFSGKIGIPLWGGFASIYDCIYFVIGMLFVSLYSTSIVSAIMTLRREAEFDLKQKAAFVTASKDKAKDLR